MPELGRGSDVSRPDGIHIEQLRAEARAHMRGVIDRLVLVAGTGCLIMQIVGAIAGHEHPLALVPTAAGLLCAILGLFARARWTPYAYLIAFYFAIVIVMVTAGPLVQLGALGMASITIAFLFVPRRPRRLLIVAFATAPLVAGVITARHVIEAPSRIELGSIHTWGPAFIVCAFALVSTVLAVRASMHRMRLAQREMARALDEERAARRERERLEGQIANARRVDLIVALAAEVGKEVGGALATIVASAEELAAELTREDAQACLADVLATAGSARGAMRSLTALDAELAEPGTGADAGRALGDLPHIVRRLLPTGVRLHVSADIAAWTPLGSTDLLRVVSNLVINARDAITGTGNIRVSLSATPTHVHIDVRDDGAGMDAETRARVFEPFFTTKPVGRGTGLGLTTSRALVERCGGSMSLDTAPGAGTTFHLVLPRLRAR